MSTYRLYVNPDYDVIECACDKYEFWCIENKLKYHYNWLGEDKFGVDKGFVFIFTSVKAAAAFRLRWC